MTGYVAVMSTAWPRRFAALGLLACGGCVSIVGPVRTAEDYRGKATGTAESVVSAMRTASVTIETADRGRAFAAFVAVSLSEAESDATGAQSTFESIQPPGSESDRLRDELTPLLDDANDALADARIAARRTDGDALADQQAPIDQDADALDQFLTEHS